MVVVEVDIPDVVRGIIVPDLAVRPFLAFHPDEVPRSDRRCRGDVGVPPVVPGNGLIPHRLTVIDTKNYFWHFKSPLRLKTALFCSWIRPPPPLLCATRVRARRRK